MVSVIIPTLNAEASIEGLVRSLNKQSIPCEVIVIDSSSSDNTVWIAGSLGAKVVVIDRRDFDHGGTRNLAARISLGDILLFLTHDALPADEYLIENLIRPLKDEDIALSYARQIPYDSAMPTEYFARTFNYPASTSINRALIKGRDDIQHLGIKTFFCSNVCSAVKANAFREVGGFPERAIMNEDMILAARLVTKGYKIAYEPSAAVYHSHNYSIFQQFKRYFDIGVSLNREQWILEFARPEEEGYRYLVEEMGYLWRNRKIWIPYAIVEAIAKYLGYRLGLMENIIPLKLKMLFSMHRYFWDN